MKHEKIEDKRILKELAKRYAKSLLMDGIDEAFDDLGFTIEQLEYISNQIMVIANKITDKELCTNVEELVSEYYELDNLPRTND